MANAPKCPKCKSRNFIASAQEFCEASADVVDGRVVGAWSNGALPERQACFGKCPCGHEWRFRDRWAIR